MRILYFCHRFPFPPARGGKIRPFNMIKHLSREHEVVVASLARSPEEAAAGRGIAAHCSSFIMEQVSAPAAWARMVARLPTPGPSSMGYFYAPAIARQIEARVRQQRFSTEESRVGKACVSQCMYRGWPYHQQKNHKAIYRITI